MKKFIIIIISVIALNLICYNDVAVFSETSELPALPEVSQSHYAIYREGNRDNRIELAVFDISDNSKQALLLEVPFTYTIGGSSEYENEIDYSINQTSLTIINNEKYCNDIKYYLDGDKWIYFQDNYDKISENATELIESDLPYYEVIRKGNSSIETIRRTVSNNFLIRSTKDYKVYVSLTDGIHDLKEMEFSGYEFPAPYVNGITHVEKFVFGNGLFVISGFEDYGDGLSGTSEKYKRGNHSNSPIHIFDEKFDLVDVVKYDGCFDIEFFYDGYFYLLHRDYSDIGTVENGTRKDTYYKSTNIRDRVEITEEEYTTAKSNYNIVYPKLQESLGGYYIYSGKLVNKDTLEELDIIWEENKENGSAAHVGYPSYCYFYESNSNHPIGISLDGVYSIILPNFTEGPNINYPTYNIWSYNQYIYFEPNYMDCFFRLPIEQFQNNILVRLNDTILGFSQPPVMESDRTLVPMRFLFEQMGATVDWNDDTKTATATLSARGGGGERNGAGENTVTFSIDNLNAIVDGEPETMDVPARLINDQTFVPLRFLSENLGYDVEWDDETNTAIISTK